MQLIFNSSEILGRGKGLTFDDVLIIPNYGEITSRRSPELKTSFTKNTQLKLPFVSANMDTVTEFEMAKKMGEVGAVGILHRFMPIDEQVAQATKLKSYFEQSGMETPVCASIGVKEEGQKRAVALIEAGVQVLTLDIAHGDSVLMLESLDFIKKTFPHVDVIAGNTATAGGVKRFVDHGADAVKVGIGPGSMCTTRIITGCGVPQLTAIALCAKEAKKHSIPVIADGGIKNSGDVVKALSAGAQSVMLGSLFAGCTETPGEIRSGKKKYRGMASKDAQVSWRGELPKGMAAEGEDTFVACKGSAALVVEELAGGLRSGMSYINAQTLLELFDKAQFMEMSGPGLFESRPHGTF